MEKLTIKSSSGNESDAVKKVIEKNHIFTDSKVTADEKKQINKLMEKVKK